MSPFEIASKLLLLEMETERTNVLLSKLYPIYESNLYKETFKKYRHGPDYHLYTVIENTKKRHRSILLNHIELYLDGKASSQRQIPYFQYIEEKTGKFPAIVHFELKTANWSTEWVNAWNEFMNACFTQALTSLPEISDRLVLKRFIVRFRKSYQSELVAFQKHAAYWQALLALTQTIEDEFNNSVIN